MASIQTRLGPVSYAIHGSGPPLVLLHANPGDRRDWDAVLPALAASHRVIAVDWPGYGDSPAPAPPAAASATGYADVLEDVVDALDLRGAIYVGNSVGGFAAARLAARRPELVRALVLVDPGGFTRHNAISRTFCRLKGRERITRLTAHAFARWYLRRRNQHVAEILARTAAQRAQPARVAVDAALWRSFLDPAHDLRAIAAHIAAPTLLVWGKHDPVLPARRDGRSARAALPHAEYVEMDTGHEPFAEAPEEFLAVVQPFLKRTMVS